MQAPDPNCKYKQISKWKYRCVQCGWIWTDKKKRGKPPRGPVCPAAPDAPPLAARILSAALAIPGARDEATIRKLLVACEACPLYDGKIGCAWGHSCKRWGLWVKRLASGQCEPWNEAFGGMDYQGDDPPRAG